MGGCVRGCGAVVSELMPSEKGALCMVCVCVCVCALFVNEFVVCVCICACKQKRAYVQVHMQV